MRSSLFRACLFLTFLAGLVAPCATTVFAQGQRNTAAILGVVTDSSGAAVPGADVKVTNEETGSEYATVSDGLGNFIVPSLPPGRYTMTVSHAGFKVFSQTGMTLEVDQKPQISAVLQLGEITQTVTVQAAVGTIDTTSANVGGTVTSTEVQALPLNGRQFLQLSMLLPGVSQNAGGQPTARGGGPRNVGVQLGGNRPTNNDYIIDGVDSFGFRFKNTSLRPSVTEIQEFKVQQNPYDPQYGVASGVTVNVITKSGTNAFHGEVFEFLRNDKLDARNFFDVTKAPYRQNDFGVALGGPIQKNKTFFFGSFEGFLSRQGATNLATVPTAAERNGDLSADPLPLTDPQTGSAFSGNVIPGGRISSVSQKFLTQYPLPNLSTTGFAVPNFLNTANAWLNDYQYDARIDHSFSDRWKVFGRYTISDVHSLSPGSLPLYGTFNNMTVTNIALGSTFMFSPKSVLDIRIGYNREAALNGSQQVGKQKSASYGITGLVVPSQVDGVPYVGIQGFAGVGDSGYSPEGRDENSEQFIADYMRIVGRHALRVGGNLWPMQLNNVFVAGDNRGVFNFTNLYTDGTTGLGEFLLGLPQQAVRDIGLSREDARSLFYNFYVADDFRFSRRLTISLGLRYEVKPAFVDKLNHLSTFIPTGDGEVVVAGKSAVSGYPANNFTGRQNRSLYPTSYKDFAPRIGFAYTLTGDNKTVLRGGYGIFYNLAIFNSQFLAALNPPFRTTETFTADPARNVVLNFADPFAAQPGAGGLPSGYSVTPWFRQGYMQAWSLGIERELAPNLGLDISYVGNKGTSLDGLRWLNQGALPGASYGAYTLPFPNFGEFLVADSFGDSIYHALEAKLTRHFANGFSLITAYTYGHAIDNSSGEGGGSGNQFISMDNNNLHRDRGNADFDLRHRFSVSAVYELPFGPKRHFLSGATGALAKLTEGWGVDAIYQAQTGLPLSVSEGGNRSGTNGGADRADRICDGSLSGGDRTRLHWFNTSCYALSPLGAFGNSARGVVRYAGVNNLDFSLIKKTQLRESTALEFRTEFFNVFNHTQFSPTGGLATDVTTPTTFGGYYAAAAPRVIQFALQLTF